MAKKKKAKNLTIKDLKKVKGGIGKSVEKGNDLEQKGYGGDGPYRNKQPGLATTKRSTTEY
jgi:bacteriocin-like protein